MTYTNHAWSAGDNRRIGCRRCGADASKLTARFEERNGRQVPVQLVCSVCGAEGTPTGLGAGPVSGGSERGDRDES